MTPHAPVSIAQQIDAEACAWIVRRDAGLTAGERSEFEKWQAADPRHAEALARFAATWSALERPRRTGSGEMLAGELRVLGRRRRTRRVTVTAAIVGVAALAGFAWWPASAPNIASRAGTARAVLLVPERRALSDGSVLEFSAETRLAIEFGPRVRRVVLERGEVHFAIAKDPARPFVVDAAGIEVRAVGTAFAVHLDPQAIEVLVTEGRVEVTPDVQHRPVGGHQWGSDNEARQPEPPTSGFGPPVPVIPLGSGSRIVMTRSATNAPAPPVQKVADAEIAQRLAWRSPRVEFSGAPLAEVVALLNRHNATQFVIADAALGSVALSGLFRASDTDVFLRMLELSFDVKAERRGNEIVLRKAR